MIINTDFHQRYDNLARQNRDTQVVYNRYEQVCPMHRHRGSSYNDNHILYTNSKKEEVVVDFPKEIRDVAGSSSWLLSFKVDEAEYLSAVLLFCGTVYLVLQEEKQACFSHYTTRKQKLIYNPDLDDLVFRNDRNKKAFVDSWNYIKDYNFTEIHRKLESPVILVGGITGAKVLDEYSVNFDTSEVTVNANLDAIKWYQVMDVWNTYEKIYTYLSGVLCLNNKDLIEISDKNRLTGHGFDAKISFRHPVKLRGKNEN